MMKDLCGRSNGFRLFIWANHREAFAAWSSKRAGERPWCCSPSVTRQTGRRRGECHLGLSAEAAMTQPCGWPQPLGSVLQVFLSPKRLQPGKCKATRIKSCWQSVRERRRRGKGLGRGRGKRAPVGHNLADVRTVGPLVSPLLFGQPSHLRSCYGQRDRLGWHNNSFFAYSRTWRTPVNRDTYLLTRCPWHCIVREHLVTPSTSVCLSVALS
jgi:hypothetical protein